MDTVIKVENISKTFYIRERNDNSLRDKVFNIFKSNSGTRAIHALTDINLEIKRGEFFGIVGHNGSGKSTLLKIIMGAYPPDKGGKVSVKGKIIRLALGMGFDPALTAKENIYVNGSVLGLSFKQIGQKFDEIIYFAELEDFVNTPIKFFSSGMRSRLSFAIAIHAEADILLMDEFFGGVGDISFKEKSNEIFEKTLLEGKTIVHVSHALHSMKDRCNRVLLLNKGKQIIIGEPVEVISQYSHILGVKDKARKKNNPHKNKRKNKGQNKGKNRNGINKIPNKN